MSGGGGTNTTVQQSSIPPNFLNAYDSAVTAAQNVASTPYNPYPGPMVAGFTQPQSQAFGQIQNLQGVAQPYLNAASNDFNSATQPLLPGIPTVDRGTLQGLAPSALDLNSASTQNFGAVPQYSGAAVQGFENPYTSQVVNATEQQFANTNAQQQQQVIGNAIGQGAWGGDRSAVAQAVLAGQQQAAQAPVIAGLENQGFSQAQGEFNTQQQLAEQQAAQKSQLQQSAAQQQLGLLSGQQQTELGANEANAWLASQAGFGQANLGNEALTTGLTASNALEGVGALGQQQAQELLNVPFEQYTAQQAYPFQTTGWEANIAEGLGSSAGGNSSTTSPSPSVLSQVGGLGAAGVGALGQSGAFGSQGWLSGLFGSGGAGGLSSSALTAISNSALADEGISGAAAAAGDFGVKRGGRITPRPGFAAGGDVALSVNSTPIPVPGNFGSSIFGQFTGLTPQITVNGTPLLPQFAGLAVPQATTPTAAAPTTPVVPTGGMTDGGVGFGGEAGGLGGLGGVGSGLADGTTGAGVGAATGAGAASPGLSGSLGGGFTGSQTAGGPNIGGTLGGGLGGLAGSMVGGAAGPIGSLAGGFAGHKGGQMLGNAFGNALGLGNHTDFSYGPADLANNAAVAGPSPGFAADLMGMGTSDPSGYGGGISSGAAAADPNSPDATNADVGIGNGAGTGFGGAGDGSGGAGGGSDQGPGAGGAEDGGGTGAGGFSKRGGRIRRFDDGGGVESDDDRFDVPNAMGSTPTGLAPSSSINAGPGGGGGFGAGMNGARPSPWTALMAAGFGALAGRSPNALTNIGTGALAGMKEYQNERDFAERTAERRAAAALNASNAQSLQQERASAGKYKEAEIQNMADRLHLSVQEAANRVAEEDKRIGIEGGHLAESQRHDQAMEGMGRWAYSGNDPATGLPVMVDGRTGETKLGNQALAPKSTDQARLDQGQTRLDQGQTKIENTQAYRDRVLTLRQNGMDQQAAEFKARQDVQQAQTGLANQFRATGQEDAGARAIMSADLSGKTSYADALTKYRSTRENMGQAQIPGPPAAPPAVRPAPQPAAIDMLRQHPEFAPQFIQKYGADAYKNTLGTPGS